jgi:hypothetical protein
MGDRQTAAAASGGSPRAAAADASACEPLPSCRRSRSRTSTSSPRGPGPTTCTLPTLDATPSRSSIPRAWLSTRSPQGDTPTYLATVPGQDVALVINIGSHTLGVLRGAAMPTDPIAIVPKANTRFRSRPTASTPWSGSTPPRPPCRPPRRCAGSTQDVSVITLSSAGDSQTTMTVGYQPTVGRVLKRRLRPPSWSRAMASHPCVSPTSRSRPSRRSPISTPPRSRWRNGTPAQPGPGRLDSGSPAVDGGASPDLGKDASADDGPRGDRQGHRRVRDSGRALRHRPARRHRAAAADRSHPYDQQHHHPPAFEPCDGSGHEPVWSPGFCGSCATKAPWSRSMFLEGFTDSTRRTPWPPLTGQTIGSVTVSAKGKYALLYTTALPSKSLVILGLQPGATIGPQIPLRYRSRFRRLPSLPMRRTALIVHTKAAGSPTATGIDSSTQLDRSYAYTMVRLDEAFAKFVVTSANPTPIRHHARFQSTPSCCCAMIRRAYVLPNVSI